MQQHAIYRQGPARRSATGNGNATNEGKQQKSDGVKRLIMMMTSATIKGKSFDLIWLLRLLSLLVCTLLSRKKFKIDSCLIKQSIWCRKLHSPIFFSYLLLQPQWLRKRAINCQDYFLNIAILFSRSAPYTPSQEVLLPETAGKRTRTTFLRPLVRIFSLFVGGKCTMR